MLIDIFRESRAEFENHNTYETIKDFPRTTILRVLENIVKEIDEKNVTIDGDFYIYLQEQIETIKNEK